MVGRYSPKAPFRIILAKIIADKLHISEGTVKVHLHSIFGKLRWAAG
jgi:FixJ family two-component response regulator